jgi:cytochrome b561
MSELREYTRTARVLHWLMALLLALQWLSGEYEDAFGGLSWHLSLGLTVLALALLRLGWRVLHPAPAFAAAMPAWEALAARALQWAWYAVMLALPLSGLLARQLRGKSTDWFGLWSLPPLLPANKSWAHTLMEWHEALAIVFLILLGLHVAAALKHRLIDGSPLFGAMGWRGA